ncbi:MAG TPA: F0F1 ATP synthase subunit epsilon [bacterium]|nr:F0F1 ATP synthase subunit epsilon [bacterium]
MARPFRLEVITPEGPVIDINVTSVVAPGIDGYVGILANHRPFMTVLTVGLLEYELESGAREVVAVTNGFLEVSDNRCTILADTAEPAPEIDLARAQEAYQRAKDRLADAHPGIDVERARTALLRAQNRVRAAQRAGAPAHR